MVARHAVGVRRFWWVVVLVPLLAASAAVFATLTTPTTYTGRSVLVMSTVDQPPSQDAVLVRGYVDLFDDPAYRSWLADAADLDGDVALAARATSSPVMVVEATTTSPTSARSAAAEVAQVFRTQVNGGADERREAQLATLQQRIDEVAASGAADTATQITSLRDRELQLELTPVSGLQSLQPDGGTATHAPGLVGYVGVGLAAGLLVGLLLAGLLGTVFRNRRFVLDTAG